MNKRNCLPKTVLLKPSYFLHIVGFYDKNDSFFLMREAFYKAAERLGTKENGDLKQNGNPIRYYFMFFKDLQVHLHLHR